tara:strand:- start:7458 stop:7577 length:120 start_codon:yes stop_codon:yes gene_type:complete
LTEISRFNVLNEQVSILREISGNLPFLFQKNEDIIKEIP